MQAPGVGHRLGRNRHNQALGNNPVPYMLAVECGEEKRERVFVLQDIERTLPMFSRNSLWWWRGWRW